MHYKDNIKGGVGGHSPSPRHSISLEVWTLNMREENLWQFSGLVTTASSGPNVKEIEVTPNSAEIIG